MHGRYELPDRIVLREEACAARLYSVGEYSLVGHAGEDEHPGRRAHLPDGERRFHAIAVGQAVVDEGDVWLELLSCLHGGGARSRLTDDDDVTLLVEDTGDTLGKQMVIVDDEHPNRLSGRCLIDV